MTPEQAAGVLAVAATFDPRLTPPSPADATLRAQAWAAALHPQMAPEWAQRAVVGHYAASREAIMPAHLNEAWRAHRAVERSREQSEQMRLSAAAAVPMPAHLKGAIRALTATSEERP